MIEQGIEALMSEYGLLGILVALLGYVVYKLYKKQEDSQEEMEAELKDLRGKFEKYIEEDRATMLETINNNTQAFRDLHNMISNKLK